MRDLPKVFENRIDKEINNNKELFYSKNDREYKSKDINVNKKINDIFKSVNHVYKSKVNINIDGSIYEKIIVGMNNNYLITIDGELISINKILDIEKI